jgi:hypothetical protein
MLHVPSVSGCRHRCCRLSVEEGYSFDILSLSVWEVEEISWIKRVCMCVCVYVCVYVCIYIYRERERESVSTIFVGKHNKQRYDKSIKQWSEKRRATQADLNVCHSAHVRSVSIYTSLPAVPLD